MGEVVGFKRHLTPVIVPGEGAFLFSEDGLTCIRGVQVEDLAHLLDGTRDVQTLIREASARMPAPLARQLIGQLADEGLVGLRSADGGSPGVASPADEARKAFWELAGLDGDSAETTLSSSRLGIVAVGGADAGPVRAACTQAGLDVMDASGAGDLTVVVCDDYLHPDLAAVQRAHRAIGAPWLLTRASGAQVWIGPVLTEGDGPCWFCLRHRLWDARPMEAAVQHGLGRPGVPAARVDASPGMLATVAAHLVALEASGWLAGRRFPRQGCIWTLRGLDLDGTVHEVRRRPECPECGNPRLVAQRSCAPVQLRSRTAVTRSGGGYRSATPEEVYERYRHLVDPITGPVAGIRRDQRGPAALNAFQAGANLAAGAGGLDACRAGLRARHGGKGVTSMDARVGALCETLERVSGTRRGDEAVVRAPYRELRDVAVHPNRCQLFDVRQFGDRERWNREHGAFQHVCEPFDDDEELDWTPVWSLTHQRQRLLPTQLLYYDAGRSRTLRADSNGCAAGASLEDAVLQGLLELVERDAVALWWYNRIRQPTVDLAAFADPWVDDVVRLHRDLNRELWALDVTSDLGIPVVVALSRRTDKAEQDVVFGFGAHLDARIALRRSVAELNQVLPAVVDARPGADYGCDDRDAVRWWRTATTAGHPYLCGDPTSQAMTPSTHGASVPEDLLEAVVTTETRCSRAGLEVLVLDQTRPDLGLPVARAIVPGLRSIWARFAPGRLYDVPVQLGRRTRPTRFEDLNPVPLFV